MCSLVGSFSVGGVPGDICGESANAAAAGRLSAAGFAALAACSAASAAARAFQAHVDPDAVDDGLKHVFGLPALAEALITRVHAVFEGQHAGHVALGFDDFVLNGVGH